MGVTPFYGAREKGVTYTPPPPGLEISSARNAGLSLSTDTHTSLEFLFNRNAFGALCRTGYGPAYVGENGGRWLSIRSYTKGHFIR